MNGAMKWYMNGIFQWEIKSFFLIVKDGDMAYYNGITMEVQLNIL